MTFGRRTQCVWKLRLDSWLDIVASLAILSTAAALTVLPDFRFAAFFALAATLMIRAWLGMIERLERLDVIPILIASIAILRNLLGDNSLGLARTAALWAGVIVYFLVRAYTHPRVMTRWTGVVCSVLGILLSLSWIGGSRIWMFRVRTSGFEEVDAFKGALVPFLPLTLNEWSSVLLILLILLLGALCAKSRVDTGLGFLATILALSACLLTFSRGIVLALVVILLSTTALTGWQLVVRREARTRVVAALLALAIALIWSNWFSEGAVWRTMRYNRAEYQQRSAYGRLHVWSTTVSLAAKNVVSGSGPGTFAMQYSPTVGEKIGQSFVGRPLNTWLGIWLEEGIIVLGLYIALLCAVSLRAVRALRMLPKRSSLLIAFCVAGLWAFLVKESTFSSLLEVPIVMIGFWFLLASIVNASSQRRSTRGRRPDWIAPLVLVSVVSMIAFVPAFIQSTSEEQVRVAASRIEGRDLNGALTLLSKPHSFYFRSYELNLRGLADGLQSMRPFDPLIVLPLLRSTDRSRYLENAFEDYNQAISLSGQDDLFYHNRGWIRLALGQNQNEAIKDFEQAIKLNGAEPVYRIALGLVSERMGIKRGALDQYAKAFAHSPSTLDSAFARDLTARDPEMTRKAVDLAIKEIRTADPNGNDVILQGHLGRLYVENGKPGDAMTAFRRVTTAMPQLSRPWVGLARIALSEGHVAIAEAYLSKAMFLHSTDPLTWLVFAAATESSGDQEDASDQKSRAAALLNSIYSQHAQRVSRIYKTEAIVRDDILPSGLLSYCSPSHLR